MRSDPRLQLSRLRLVVSVALIGGFGLTWRLWISTRPFPLIPVSASLPAIPFPFDYIAASLLLALPIAVIAVPRPRLVLTVFLAFAATLSLWDQMRWQPWFYQLMFMLAAVAFCMWQSQDDKSPRAAESGRAALDTCRLIIIATYFWGGVQKANPIFIHQTLPDMAAAAIRLLPNALAKLPEFLAWVMPALEISFGTGLLFPKTRKVSAALAIAMHLAILVLLISTGENNAVWPWNAALIALVWLLFWNDRETRFFERFPANWFQAAALLLFGLLPALSFSGAWDSYLSAALYSGSVEQAAIYLSPAAIQSLPETLRPYIWQQSQPYFLDINRWSYGDLNVPVYPEPRVFRRVAQQVCIDAGESKSDLRLRIFERPNPFSGARRSDFYDCDHLSDP